MKNLLCALFLVFSIIGFNQENVSTTLPYIDVIGSAELEIVPDEIYISITFHQKWEEIFVRFLIA